jgi:hypothetical protein
LIRIPVSLLSARSRAASPFNYWLGSSSRNSTSDRALPPKNRLDGPRPRYAASASRELLGPNLKSSKFF